MKIIPIAFNRVELELENGMLLDVNDGTQVLGGKLLIQPAITNKIKLLPEEIIIIHKGR